MSAKVQPSLLIRYMAGNHYLDIADMLGVVVETVYPTIHLVEAAVNAEFACQVSFPLDDESAL